MGGVTPTPIVVREANPADVQPLAGFAAATMQGAWTCTLQGTAAPDAEHLKNLQASNRFAIIGAFVGLEPRAFAVVELANEQIWWLIVTPDHEQAARMCMAEVKRRFDKSWGNVENPSTRAWISKLVPTMKVSGQRIDV